MPFADLRLIPGVNSEWTPTLNTTGISASNLIRHRGGLVEKLGGWTRYYLNVLSDIPRCLHAWEDLNSIKHLAVGTSTQFGVITAGSLIDLTPQTSISDVAPSFTTTIGSSIVTIDDSNTSNLTTFDAVFLNTPVSVGGIIVNGLYPIINITGANQYQIDTATPATAPVTTGGAVPQFDTTLDSATVTVTLNDHGQLVGDRFDFVIPTTGGGVTIQGGYIVNAVGSVNTFTITASNQATSTATFDMNGGDVEFVYYISLGPPPVGSGYGLGGYGDGGYGTGVIPSPDTGTPITTTDWTIDNWGEIVVACPKNGGIYSWEPNSGFGNLALVATAPAFNSGIFVAMPEQILVAYGSTPIGSTQQDPLLVRWSNILDFTNWTVTSQTQAGDFHIPTGSAIIGALQAAQQGLIWTDVGIWAMQYIGYPLIFSFNQIGFGCGLVGPHAMTTLRGSVFWMSQENFYMLTSSGATVLPCSVWDVVFQDLDTAHQNKCVAASNSGFNEVAFYYPSLSGGTGECDKYVKVNLSEPNTPWDYGTLSRTAWIDQGILGPPVGASAQKLIFQHETSLDADGQAMDSFFESGFAIIGDAENFAFVDQFIPDMKWGLFNGSQGANVQMMLTMVDYPTATPMIAGPYTVMQASQYVSTRLRGRMLKWRIESTDVGSFWRMGLPRYRWGVDGRR
jgi:hypothetical protein